MDRSEFELCLKGLKNFYRQRGMDADLIEFELSCLEEFYSLASGNNSEEVSIDVNTHALYLIKILCTIAQDAAMSEKGFKLAFSLCKKLKNWQEEAVSLIERQAAALEVRAALSDKFLDAAKSHAAIGKELSYKTEQMLKGASQGGKLPNVVMTRPM